LPETELLIATHCEDEAIIQSKSSGKIKKQQTKIRTIRSPGHQEMKKACFESSFRAIQYAKKKYKQPFAHPSYQH